MKVFYGLKNVKKFRNAVVVLGVFDGVHAGHRRILFETVRKAHCIKGKGVIVTFWPHPRKTESIYSLEHRLKLIAGFGLDACVCIKFNKFFSNTSPYDFVKDILVGKIGAKYIYVGENFTFGRGASGDTALLKRLSEEFGFKLKAFEVLKTHNLAISSTYIRRLIKEGKLSEAQKLLMRPVSILGTVIRGASLAKKLGFPTANIDPHHEVLPPSGVYSVRVLIGRRKYPGICYIGNKPTLAKTKIQHIEAHIFDFKKNIYGKYLEIQFIKLLRKERKFSSLRSLAEQIRKDIISAK